MTTKKGALDYGSSTLDYYRLHALQSSIMQHCLNVVAVNIHRACTEDEWLFRLQQLSADIAEYQAIHSAGVPFAVPGFGGTARPTTPRPTRKAAR